MEEDDVERYKSDEKGDWYEACESCQRRMQQKIETKSLERRRKVEQVEKSGGELS